MCAMKAVGSFLFIK